jgi:hypothetical protein
MSKNGTLNIQQPFKKKPGEHQPLVLGKWWDSPSQKNKQKTAKPNIRQTKMLQVQVQVFVSYIIAMSVLGKGRFS